MALMTVTGPASSINKLPAGLRARALKKLSANANAPGGSKKQIARAQQAAARNLRNALGIYLIESRVTGALAASVGGASPASIATSTGTPDPAVIDANELEATTWLGAGTKTLTATATGVTGQADIVV